MASKDSKFQVQWEDEDTDFAAELGHKEEDDGGQEFLDLLRHNDKDASFTVPSVGDRVEARISYLSETSSDVLLELGGKVSAVMAKQDLLREDGTLPYKVGDMVTAFVVSGDGGGDIVLSNSLSHAVAKQHALEAAYESRLPVRGKVTGVNKGGFEVMIMGRKAFCPVSQIDLRFVEDTKAFVGKELDFLIQKLASRDVVVSRAALLRAQAGETLAALKEKIAVDPVVEGTVIEVKDFGAIVDLGGVSGMIHISELGHGHAQHARELVKPGDRLRVKILKIEDGEKSPRIALSLKALAQDPWEDVGSAFRVGESYTGRVVRLTDFGAFVELKPGIDGLLHVSEMSWEKRVHRPQEVVQVGDQVSVRVTDIDTAKKRIALSMKAVEKDPWYGAEERFAVGSVQMATVESLKPFGAFITLAPGVQGLLPAAVLKEAFGESYKRQASPGTEHEVKVVTVGQASRRILLSLKNFVAQDDGYSDYTEYLKQNTAAKAQQAAAQTKASGSLGDLLQESMNKKRR